ncbi:hypothetical protein [Lacinutrix sp. MEBiC02404]
MSDYKKCFGVGDLVVFKTHPLLKNYRIKGDGKYVPPIMIVKEVFFENNKKITNDEITGRKISEKTKYTCVFFNDSKSEFVESNHYQSELLGFDNLKIERINKDGSISYNSDTIIKEIKNYGELEYVFSEIVRFKTKKLEIYKKRSSKKIPINNKGKVDEKKIKSIVQYVVNYTTPDFLISGYKKNDVTNLYYPNGNPKRLVSDSLLKVKWFNPFQNKFSEQFLPIEFFTNKMILEKEESPSFSEGLGEEE